MNKHATYTFYLVGSFALAGIIGCSSTVINNANADAGAAGDGGGGGEGGGGDGATSGTPPVVNIQFPASCPTFTACGGDLPGTWFYTTACIADPFSGVKTVCPGVTVTNPSGTVQGKLVFTGTTVSRDAKGSVSATLSVPASCNPTTCADVQSAINTGTTTGTCTAAGSGCTCNVTSTFNGDGTPGTYTVSNGTLTTGSGATYEFCAAGSNLKHRATSTNGTEPGSYELTKQ